MARIYIKDLIKSMLKLDTMNECKTHSTVSLCSRASTDDETDDSMSQHTIGLHSPGGPMRGRSVKEFEETLTNLRKENFNLKLRIYFLEERMGTNFNLDKENAIKKNIELKVEVESLRKEVMEKQDLLIQAVKAMELEEDEHKKDSYDKDKHIANLKMELESLQQKYDDEIQCQGDHMEDDQKDMMYPQSYQLRKNDSGQQSIIKELENRVQDMEMQLSKEKDNVNELENLLQLTDNKHESIANLETEIKHKEDTIKKLITELEDRGKRLTSYSVRINDLEEDLLEKKKDLDYMRKDSKDKIGQIQELQLEVEELHKLLSEAQTLYDLEKRKVDKHKSAILQRNAKIIELENHLEKHKVKLMSAEAKLESLQNEVKSKSDEPQTPPKGPLRMPKSSNTDVDSFLVRHAPAAAELSPKKNLQKLKNQIGSPQRSLTSFSSNNEEDNSSALVSYSPETSHEAPTKVHQLQKDLAKSKKHIFKLEQDQLRACKIIQSMLEMRKKNTKEIEELKSILLKKETQIEHYNAQVGKSDAKETKSLQAKITELNLTATVNPSADSETSVADINEDPKVLLEQYKELTDSLEEQKQILLLTLNESKTQMHAVENKYDTLLTELKAKENRIVDLEFELLSMNQGVGDMQCEKSDVGNEKPSNFFIKELEDKDKEIERLEHELRKRTCDLQSLVNNELWEKNREIEKLQKRYGDIITDKDQEISKLVLSVTNKDEQLGVLKDRIFEMNVDSSLVKEACDVKNMTETINEDIKCLEEKLRVCVDERNYFKNQVDKLEGELKHVNDNELAVLKEEFSALQAELGRCEKLRSETTEVCNALSTRLEELAVFLDSLLKQKIVLGFLGYKENYKIRQLVNQTLDISRSLTMSMSLNPNESLLQLSNISTFLNVSNNETLPDTEAFDEEEENAILSVIPNSCTLTYQSHLYQASEAPANKIAEQAQIITILRSQIGDLKKEVELRDNELNKFTHKSEEILASYQDIDCKKLTVSKLPSNLSAELLQNDQQLVDVLIAMTPDASDSKIETPQKIMESLLFDKLNKLSPSPDKSLNTSTTLKYRTDNQSESESWSEPDRTVSKARIGIYDESLKPNRKINKISEGISTEDDEGMIVLRTSSRKNVLAENRQTIIILQEKITELENELNEKDKELVVIQLALKESEKLLSDERRRNDNAENQKEIFIQQIEDTERRLKIAESGKVDALCKLEELQNTVKEVKLSQKLLQDTLEIKSKEMHNKINLLEMEKDQVVEALMIAEQTADEAKIDVDAAEKKLKLMKEEMLLIEDSIKREARHELEQIINRKELEFEAKYKNIEREGEFKVKRLTDAVQELQSKYDAEYVKRCEVDKLMNTIKDLEHVQQIVKVAEDKIHSLEESESMLKQRLHETELEYRDRVNSLLQELEKANLLYSETLLEKSRILNDKSELDRQLKEFNEKENEFVKQVSEYKEDFTNMKDNFQRQLTHLEQAKSKLEVHISELEQSNAALRNRLIRLHSGDPALSKSAPNSPSRILDLFLNKTCPPAFRRQCSENSGYTSEDMPNEGARRFMQACMEIVPIDVERQNSNSSPDLGIESDHGRFSSLEASVNITRPCLKTLELTESMSNLLNIDRTDSSLCNNDVCCNKTKEIVNENNDLRKRLLRTRRALEETVSQLKSANQRKRQVEKTICKQIHKTSQVLRKAKANLDSGSESELKK